jgi:hypothetical protein
MLLVGGRSSTGEDVAVSAPNPPHAGGRLPDGPGRPRDTGQLADYTPVKLADFSVLVWGIFTLKFFYGKYRNYQPSSADFFLLGSVGLKML